MKTRKLATAAARVVREPVTWYFSTMLSVLSVSPANPAVPLLLLSAGRASSTPNSKRR